MFGEKALLCGQIQIPLQLRRHADRQYDRIGCWIQLAVMPADAFQHQIAGLGIRRFYALEDMFVPEMRFHLNHILLHGLIAFNPPVDEFVFVV